MIFRTVLGQRLGLRRTTRQDAGIPIPGKDWPDDAQTPVERGIGSLVELGAAETNERYARRLRWILPRLYGREQRVINLTDRIDAVDAARSPVYKKLEDAEKDQPLGYLPRLSVLVEWVAVVALAIADFPLNITSFAVVPLSTKALDVMVAALGVVLAIAPVVLAKVVTAAIEANTREERATHIAEFLGLITALAFGIQGLSFMRARFVETSPALRSLGVGLSGVGAALTKIQVCLMAVAFVAAVLAHNPAATRRRRQKAVIVWLSVRLWLLGRHRDIVAVSVAVAGAVVSLVTMWYAARIERVRAWCSFLIQAYRARLLRRHPDAADPKVGNRPSPTLPDTELELLPELWEMPSQAQAVGPIELTPGTMPTFAGSANGERVDEEE